MSPPLPPFDSSALSSPMAHSPCISGKRVTLRSLPIDGTRKSHGMRYLKEKTPPKVPKLTTHGGKNRYLLDKYDTLNQLLPRSPAERTKCQTYIHAAEGTFLLHGLVPFYISLASAAAAAELHPQLVEAAGKDMDWLESELRRSEGSSGSSRYLVGDSVTAADTMMGFSVQFLLVFGLVPKGKEWPCVARWLGNVESNKVSLFVRRVFSLFDSFL